MIFDLSPGARALEAYARRTGRKVTRCLYTRGFSTGRRELTLAGAPYRTTLRAGWTWIEAVIMGFATPLHFSLNRPDTIYPSCKPLVDRVGRRGLVAYAQADADSWAVESWLRDPANVAAIDALEIGARDGLYVYKNALVLYGRASRDWPASVELLIAIVRRLPSRPPPPGSAPA